MEQNTYGAYGQSAPTSDHRRAAYTGEIREDGTGWYVLGMRVYVPAMRRLLSPDDTSPFGSGGINRYAYCGGDPIGRSDPSGRSWWSWVASTMDRIELPITTARRPSGSHDAFTTPKLAATFVLRPESAALRTTIRRGAPLDELVGEIRSYGNARVPVSGPGSQQTRMLFGTDFPGVQWPRVGKTLSATLFTPDRRTIHVITGPSAFSNDPTRASRAARGVTYPHWLERTNDNGGIQFAATTPVNLSYMRSLKNYIDAAHPGVPITMFAGAHGGQGMKVWENGRRKHLEQRFFDSVERKVNDLRWSVTLVNYADVNAEDMRNHMQYGKGVGIHFTCYGATDHMLMQALNITDVTSRSLYPVPFPDAPSP